MLLLFSIVQIFILQILKLALLVESEILLEFKFFLIRYQITHMPLLKTLELLFEPCIGLQVGMIVFYKSGNLFFHVFD